MFEKKPLSDTVLNHIGGGTPARQNPSYWNGDIPWASVKDFNENSSIILFTEETITKSGLLASTSNLIPAGTPLVCTRMAVGRAAIFNKPTAINQDVKALFPARGIDSSYLLYLLHSIQPIAESQAIGSTVKGIRIKDYLNISVYLAPNEEQPKIAQILDTLDTTIRQTEAIIAKLQQVKQGLLHDLLTRGIDANGQLRPPVEQAPHLYKESPLGWIPREWEICLLDEVAIRGSGHTPNKSVLGYWNGGIKWVSLADSDKLDQIFIWDTDKQISEIGIANSSAVKHPSGTVILSRDAGVGKSAILGEQMAVSQHFMAWQCGKRLNNVFLYYWLQSNKPQFESIAMGSTIKTIGLPFFKHLQIVVPPRREQDAAGEVMFATESDLKTNQSKLLKYRMLKSALMDDLLTGRVRVTALLSSETPASKELERKSE